MKQLFLIISFLISTYSYSQYDYGNTNDALELCIALQAKSFNTFSKSTDNSGTLSSISEANNALEKILATVGASKRFIIRPCSQINNALAIQYKGLRYIFYDPDFINSVSKDNSWSSLFILAHEVGHHINGHALDIMLYSTETVKNVSLAENRKQELEADEFAGFVLAKLGASLEQTISIINVFTNDDNDDNSTHPNRSKRLDAVKLGYNKAFNNEVLKINRKKIADDFFYSGLDKVDIGNYEGAIKDFTIAIGLNDTKSAFFTIRGNTYGFDQQFEKATLDYKKAIDLDPNEAYNYLALGFMNEFLENYKDAIKYYQNAIDLNYDSLETAHYQIGKLYFTEFKNSDKSIEYLDNAININPNFIDAYFYRGLCYGFKDQNYEAVFNLTKVIELSDSNNPILSDAYYYRAIGKAELDDMEGFCRDMQKASELGNSSALKYLKEYCN